MGFDGAGGDVEFVGYLLLGKTLEQLREITADQIAEGLGGLAPATRHGSQLAEDALDMILDAIS